MNLQQLIYFKTVCEKKSISKAAEELFLSHQTVSQVIQSLEKEYHVQLFYRIPKGVTLTDEGKRFLEFVNQILILDSEIREEFELQPEPEIDEKNLQIATNYIFNEHLLPSLYTQFEISFPNVAITSAVLTEQEVIEAVKTGKADIGFLNNINIKKQDFLVIPEDMIFVSLIDRKYQLVVNQEHPLRNNKTISIKELSRWPMVVLKDSILSGRNETIFMEFIKYCGVLNLNICDSRKHLMEKMQKNKDLIMLSFSGVSFNQNKAFAEVKLRENVLAQFGYILNKDSKTNKALIAFLNQLKKINFEFLEN